MHSPSFFLNKCPLHLKKTDIFKFFCVHTSVWVKSVFSLGKKPILRRRIGFFPGEMLTLLVLKKFVNTIRLSGLDEKREDYELE